MKQVGVRSVRPRMVSLALGASMAAIAAGVGSPAAAQCSPDPTVANGTTTCSGTDADGLVVATSSRVIVNEGASIEAGAVRPGAITLAQPSSGFAAIAALENAGTINSANGRAIAPGGDPGRVGLTSLVNRSGATISGASGAIGVIVERLNNAGRIDGGAGSAYTYSASSDGGAVLFPSSLINTGVITSNSAAATLALSFGSPFVDNSGRIENTGSGLAISAGNKSIGLTNTATGVIASGGPVAIGDGSNISILNAGLITGSVQGGDFAFGDYLDTRSGTIDGDVRLNNGGDQLIARMGDTRLVGGVTGSVDGGAGFDILELIVDSDRTLTGFTPPTGFEVLQLDLANDATLTVAGPPLSGGYYVRGTGTVAIGSDISTTGPVLNPNYVQFNVGFEALRFTNDRTVTTTLASPNDYAIRLNSVESAINTGTITALGGNGVAFSSANDLLTINSGSITAMGTALQVSRRLENSGLIRSTAGTAVVNDLGGGTVREVTSENSGRIEGVTAGLSLSSLVLVNSGAISASAGIGVQASGATIDNRAGGAISGTTAAIHTDGFFENYVANAGVINGAVDFGSASQFSNSRDWFVDRGGVVNGGVWMGGGDDVFVTELGRDGGVTGVIDGGGGVDEFRFRTEVDATATVATPPSTFELVGYEVANDAKLTLTSAAPVAAGIVLSGQGVIDLTADASQADRPVVDLSQLNSTQALEGYPYPTTNRLEVVSRGTLSLTVGGTTFSPAVQVGSSTFENVGAINVTSAANNNILVAAIASYASFPSEPNGTMVNSGAINLTGRALVGVLGGEQFTNTGRITGSGSNLITGVSATRRVVNSGMIEVTGAGVSLGSEFGFGAPGSLTNSGTIASTAGPAVRSTVFGSTVDNQVGGVISGREAIYLPGGTVANAGTINGTVQLATMFQGNAGYEPAAFALAGGVVNGGVLFGAGDDLFLQLGETAGVTGRIDGGDGFDVFGRAYSSSATVVLGELGGVNFEGQLVQARGTDVAVTLTGEATADSILYVGGDGRIVNQATLGGILVTGTPYPHYFGSAPLAAFGADLVPAEIRNEGTIEKGFRGAARSFSNTGSIGSDAVEGEAVSIFGAGDVLFANSGEITGAGGGANVEVEKAGLVSLRNDGRITGGLLGYAQLGGDAPGGLSAVNNGAITATEDFAVDLYMDAFTGGGDLSFTNAGLVSSSGLAGVQVTIDGDQDSGFSIINAGRIEGTGSGSAEAFFVGNDPVDSSVVEATAFTPGRAVSVYGGGTQGGTIVNAASGVIAATGAESVAVLTTRTALVLDNSGRIEGGAGATRTPSDFPVTVFDTLPYLAGAVQSLRAFDDTIRNTGAIIGSIDLGAGNDQIENRSAIDGAVFLRAGDDRYLQGAGGALTGVADGGDGTDAIEVDATGGGAVAAERFVNFERLIQSGAGVIAYSGAFSVPTLELNGGMARVEAGQSFSTAGTLAVTGSDAAEGVEVVGTLAGAVALGGGDDMFAELGEGRATGLVDAGPGVDLYRVSLAGDRAGLSANTGFERLGVDGAGTLSLTLEQGFESVALSGAGLDLRLNGFAIGALEGDASAERLAADGDVARVAMGGGDDAVRLAGSSFSGGYDGGAGADSLRLAGAGPATLSGTAAGFETVAVDGGALTVTGALGRPGDTVAFGEGAQTLVVAQGGRLQGAFDLGAGDDRFRLGAGGTLGGTVAGGAGADRAEIELTGDVTLAAGALTGFEALSVEGAGALTLTNGGFAVDRIDAAGELRVAADAALATAVRFGDGDDRFGIAGGFAGSVAGGAGNDTVEVSGGSAATPVAFSSITELETFRMTGGFATIAGSGALGSVDLSGGRLVGLAGSTLTASTFNVRQAATFGSAGTVNGGVAVAGTLSPGASPGVMTVNGNVSLAGTSMSVFEITPTASDRLVVNGAVSIASGATLQIVPTGQVQPGASLDLITASGGITGSFTNVVKPDSLFGFLVQQGNRIQLLGQFRNDAGFGPQVGSTIDYVNSVLVSGRASAGLVAAAPGLVGADGASNGQLFALIAPEAYASARQAAVENGLTLAEAGRGAGFASRRTEPGLFTFGQFAADQRTLRADESRGTARARFGGYGVFGGLGYAGDGWSLGGFIGYLDGRQRLDGRSAETELDGTVFGVHGRATSGALGLTAMVAYAATEADTRRALPGGSARGTYDLTGLTLDVAATYEIAIGSDWALRPRIGGTVIRIDRDAVAETGPTAFAAQVARDRDTAAFVDGALTIAGGMTPGATVRPYATLGLRYQAAGRDAQALTGFGGGGLGLIVGGAERARVLGTATLGVEADLAPDVTLLSALAAERGEDDRRESARIGLRVHF